MPSRLIYDAVDELLRFRRSPTHATKRFRKSKHDRDLRPKIALQLDTMMECFQRHKGVVYDVQGVHFSKNQSATVIDPTFCSGFLQLNTTRINVLVESLMRRGDAVVEEAKSLLVDLTPTEAGLLVAAVCLDIAESCHGHIPTESFMTLTFMQQLYTTVPDLERDHFFYGEEAVAHSQNRDIAERIAEDIENCSNFLRRNSSNDLIVETANARVLQALVFDRMVRYNYGGNDLMEHTFNALGGLERFGIPEEDQDFIAVE